MFKPLFIAIALCVFAGSFASALDTSPSDACDARLVKGRGGDEPFPLGAILKMPWAELEGYWETVGAIKYKFSVRVIKVAPDGTKFVMVKFMNPSTLSVVAHGVGIVKRDERVLRAFLRGSSLQVDLSISAHTLVELRDGCLARRALAVRMRLMNARGQEEINRTMLLRKITI